MNNICKIIFCLASLCALSAIAQLTATVLPVKTTDQKAVVQVVMKNGLAIKVESARAICFLLDDQGKMVGQSTKWVIGGSKQRPALEPKMETTFNFVITSSPPFTTTNLTAKLSFSRVVLQGEKIANLKSDVQIQYPQ